MTQLPGKCPTASPQDVRLLSSCKMLTGLRKGLQEPSRWEMGTGQRWTWAAQKLLPLAMLPTAFADFCVCPAPALPAGAVMSSVLVWWPPKATVTRPRGHKTGFAYPGSSQGFLFILRAPGNFQKAESWRKSFLIASAVGAFPVGFPRPLSALRFSCSP